MSKYKKFPTFSNQNQNSSWRATDCSLVILVLCSRPLLSCEESQSHYRIIPRSLISLELMMAEQCYDWLKLDACVHHFCSFPPKIVWLSCLNFVVCLFVCLGFPANGPNCCCYSVSFNTTRCSKILYPIRFFFILSLYCT